MSGDDYDTAELFDYLNAAGVRTAVVNMPSMYPPREIDGYIVSGGPDAVEGEYRSLETGYTYPESFERELADRYDYQVHPDPLLSSNQEQGEEVEEILRLLELRLEVARDLFVEEELEFTHVTLFYLNVLHHFFWGGNRDAPPWAIAAGFALAILAPISARLVQLAMSRRREYLADASGAKMTRYPEGLASALENVLCDNKTRSKLITMGRTRAQAFTWEQTAMETERVFESVQ
jgi:glycosyltransferase involved in cell wall biosynthesis